MQKSETIGELAKALSVVQGKLEGAKKDSVNPFYKSTYADLSSVWGACRKLLSDNGLAVVQTNTLTDNETIVVDTTLIHSSGEWIGGQLTLTPAKTDPQGMGSAMTYGRRYGLSAIVGIAPDDDDDGESTSIKETEQPKKESKKTLSVAEGLKECCTKLEWGQDNWKAYIKEQFDKDTLGQLTQEEKKKALAGLKALCLTKTAGVQAALTTE